MQRYLFNFLGRCLVGFGVLLGGCSQSVEEPVDIVASIGERHITRTDLHAEAAWRRARGIPALETDVLLDKLLKEEALLLQAREQGLDRDPEINREINRLLASRFRDREMKARLEAIAVSDDEVRARYEANSESYVRPGADRLAVIWVQFHRADSDPKRRELRQRIETARQQALKQERRGGRGVAAQGFGALAIEFSDDPLSRYRGGDLGWLAQDQPSVRIPPAVLMAGRDLALQAVSDVIETENGFYLVTKTDSRPSVTTPYERVEETLRQKIFVEKRIASEAALIQECLERSGVQIHEDRLMAMRLPIDPEKESTPAMLEIPILN